MRLSRLCFLWLLLAGTGFVFAACKTRTFVEKSTPTNALPAESIAGSVDPDLEPVIISGPACNLDSRPEIGSTHERWKKLALSLRKILLPGACATLVVSPYVITGLSLPPSAPASLLPESERTCTTASYLGDVTTIADEFTGQIYRAPSLEDARKTSVQCELPRNVELDSTSQLKGSFRWKLARAYLSHIALAGTAASSMTGDSSGNSSRLLLHFLLGSGRPVIIKDPKLLADLKETWWSKWEKDGRPFSGKMFAQYGDLKSSSPTQQSSLVASLGRFPLYFQQLTDGKYAIWVNDLYTFPLRSDNRTGNPADARSIGHGLNVWVGKNAQVLKIALSLLGEEGKQFIVAENQEKGNNYSVTILDEFFHNMQYPGGAKDFQMFTMVVIDPVARTIQYVQPPVYAPNLRQALENDQPRRVPEDFDRMYIKYRELHKVGAPTGGGS